MDRIQSAAQLLKCAYDLETAVLFQFSDDAVVDQILGF
jgi:hypothetical protein